MTRRTRRPRTRNGLIEAIYKMIGDETWNIAPVNYTVAEKAVEMTERYYGISEGA